MHFKVDDVRIREIKELATPAHLLREFPCSEKTEELTYNTRQAIHRVLHGSDDRVLVTIGPCSMHDPKAGLEYGTKLLEMKKELERDLIVVMRVYFEKPRTTVGWKGLINDPDLDGSFQINKGLRLARELLMEINEAGLPAGTEFLDMISPQYYADLVSWGAIGARTTESQVHRELASGLSCAVGFKNGTDGNVRIAVDALKAAREVARQVATGEDRVIGLMVESHLKAGRQDLVPGKPLVYGQSITDACIGWEDSVPLLKNLAEAVRKRRLVKAEES